MENATLPNGLKYDGAFPENWGKKWDKYWNKQKLIRFDLSWQTNELKDENNEAF